jgi:hypothetical protein
VKWPWTRKASREQLLSDHFDGALRGRAARDVEEAAKWDPDAQRRLAEYGRLRHAVQETDPPTDDQPDAEYLAAVMARIGGEGAVETGTPTRRYWLLAPASGLALVAVAFVVWRVVTPREGPSASGTVVGGSAMSSRTAFAPPAESAAVDAGESARQRDAPAAAVTEKLSSAGHPLAGGSSLPTALAASAPATDPAAGAAADLVDGAAITQPAVSTLVTLRSGAEMPAPVAYAADAAKLLPYTLRIVESGALAHSVGLQTGAELTFTRDGVLHTVSVGREEDGRWSVASAYQADGALIAAERRERLFRLSGADVTGVASDGPLARFRIAQPLVGTERLYAEVVATVVAPTHPESAAPEEGPGDAPD